MASEMAASATRVAVANDLLHIAVIPYRSPRRLITLILVILVRGPVIFRSRFKLIRTRARIRKNKSDVFFTYLLRRPYTPKNFSRPELASP